MLITSLNYNLTLINGVHGAYWNDTIFYQSNVSTIWIAYLSNVLRNLDSSECGGFTRKYFPGKCCTVSSVRTVGWAQVRTRLQFYYCHNVIMSGRMCSSRRPTGRGKSHCSGPSLITTGNGNAREKSFVHRTRNRLRNVFTPRSLSWKSKCYFVFVGENTRRGRSGGFGRTAFGGGYRTITRAQAKNEQPHQRAAAFPTNFCQ